MSIEDAFKHPERANLTDEQFRMVMEERTRARNTRFGLAAFTVIVLGISSIVVTIILASNGAFGG